MIAGALAVLPAAALGLAVLVDRGDNGELRPPWFPLALFVSDPFARTCVRNSLIFAGAVTVASLVLGVALGMVVGRGRLWGRGALRALLASMLAASPACLALGIGNLLERRGFPEAPASWRAAACGGMSLESWNGLAAWGCWAWATLPAAVALVALATASGVDRVGAAWLDAARLSGAGRLGSWYRVTWPMIRPRAARAAAIVFPMALLEPGAPLILGLRRTLAYQIVESAGRPAPFPRVAVWTAMAAVISFAARWLLRTWGGPQRLPESARNGLASARPVVAVLPAILRAATLILAVAAGWLPAIGLIAVAGGTDLAGTGPAGSLREWVHRALGPPVAHLIVESAWLGIEVGAVVLALAWMLRPDPGSRLGASFRSRFAGRLAGMPPLVQGVGILALPGLLGTLATAAERAVPTRSGLAGFLAAVAVELDVARNPRAILAAAVALSVGSRLLPRWRLAAGANPLETRTGLDAALLVGATRARARGLAALRPYRWAGAFLLAALLAATNLAPALLAATWADIRTMAPGLLVLADGPGDARLRASLLALGLLLLNLAALGLARLAPAPPAEWDGDRIA